MLGSLIAGIGGGLVAFAAGPADRLEWWLAMAGALLVLFGQHVD